MKDIGDFIKELKTYFTTNGHLQQFTTAIVPPPTKKNLSANKAGIEDKSKEENPEKQKEFNDNFDKSKVQKKVEDKFKKDLIDSMSKLCNDSNSTIEIGSLQEFKDFCKKNKKYACFCCFSINCLARQRASKAAKIKKVFNNKCGKKQFTLGEVKAMANKNDTPKKDEGTSVGATASITSTYEPHQAEILSVMDVILVEKKSQR